MATLTSTLSKEAVGDLRNNLMKLTREIRRMKIAVDINLQGLSLGCPTAFLPILHASIMLYSLPLANWLTRQGYELYAKSDLRFIEGLYKVMRDVFHYHPRLSKEQFLSVGFVERKVILTTHVLLLCQAHHQQLTIKEDTMRKRKAPKLTTNSSIMTIVRAERDSVHQSPHQPTTLPQSDVLHTVNDMEQSGSLQPNTLHCMYPPTSATPNSDLELTPQSSTGSIDMGNSSAQDLVHSIVDSNDHSSVTMDTQTTGITHTIDSSFMPPPICLPSCETSQEREAITQKTVCDVQLSTDKSIEVLLNISSRVDNLVRLVESMSARVDLVETQMKLIDSNSKSSTAQHGTCKEDLMSAHSRANADTPRIPGHTRHEECNDSEQSTLPHTQCCTLHQTDSYTIHRHTHSPTPHSTPTNTMTNHMLPSTSIATSKDPHHHQPPSLTHSSREYSPYPTHNTPSTPKEACHLIDSLRARAKKTRDFLRHANSSIHYQT